VADGQPSRRAAKHAERDSAYCEQDGFSKDHIHNVELRCSHRFQNSDFAGALHHCSVHGLKNDDEADHHTDADDYANECVETGQMTGSHLPGFNAFIGVVIGVSVVISFIVIFQAMYTAVMERTREIGILKSMGASKFYVVNVILRETILLAIGGIALGMLCSTAGRLAIRHKLPLLTVVITSDWLIRATIIAIVGAIAGALYPAFKAAQKDPIEALAYE